MERKGELMGSGLYLGAIQVIQKDFQRYNMLVKNNITNNP